MKMKASKLSKSVPAVAETSKAPAFNSVSSSIAVAKSQSKIESSKALPQEHIPKLETLDNFNGFKVLPITLPPIPLTTSHITTTAPFPFLPITQYSATHPIYFKQHQSRSADIPSGRSLFVLNLPTDCTTRHLQRIFRRCGEIEIIVIKNKDNSENEGTERVFLKGDAKAYVVFNAEESVEKALAMKKRKRVWSDVLDDDVPPQPLGFELWAAEFAAARPPIEELQMEVDEYIQAFEAAEEERKRKILEMRNKPDEDGFVTVVRHGKRNTNTDPHGATVTAFNPEDAKKLVERGHRNKKKKSKELVDFYRFQMRETKRNQLADLRRKFEEDKKKIESLKASRKFKPY